MNKERFVVQGRNERWRRKRDWGQRDLLGLLLGKVLSQFVEELECVEVVRAGDSRGVSSLYADSEVLGQESGLHGLDAHGLEVGGKLLKSGVVVELSTMRESTGPGVDRGWNKTVGNYR